MVPLNTQRYTHSNSQGWVCWSFKLLAIGASSWLSVYTNAIYFQHWWFNLSFKPWVVVILLIALVLLFTCEESIFMIYFCKVHAIHSKGHNQKVFTLYCTQHVIVTLLSLNSTKYVRKRHRHIHWTYGGKLNPILCKNYTFCVTYIVSNILYF